MAPTRRATLVVGIDFGTTFSGVAYSLVRGNSPPTNIHVISQWRGVNQLSTYERVKVPTKIWYNPAGEIVWGYEVPDDADPIEWFKLLLVKEEDLSEKLQKSINIQTSKDKLAVLGKDVTAVVGDYLGQLWEYALDQMKRTLSHSVDAAPLKVVLTIPAIWPEYARKKMLKAAELAGICEDRLSGDTVVDLVTEPEAAAIATISSVLPECPDVQPGDSMVVLDLGGGTADTISYIVEETDPVPKFREIAEGDGSFHGAKLLDQEFETYIKEYVGAQNWEQCSQFHSRILSESWEYSIKPSFDNTDRPWVVDTIVREKIYLNKKQIADCFDRSVIPGIKDLVDNQIKRIKEETGNIPKFVCLVGGFGRCPYIYNSLKYGPCRENNIHLLQATDSGPWSCVSRGAVQFGANIQPSTRRARYSYGWSTDESFDPRRHLVEDRYWDEGRSEYMAKNQVHWPIKRGQEVKSSETAYSYSMVFHTQTEGPCVHKYRFYKSSLEDPPGRIINDLDCDKGDEVVDGVKLLGHIRLRTPGGVEDLPKRPNAQGKVFPVLEWDWEIRVSGSSVDMIASTPDGDQIGALEIDITK